jgi:hypothetical protein
MMGLNDTITSIQEYQLEEYFDSTIIITASGRAVLLNNDVDDCKLFKEVSSWPLEDWVKALPPRAADDGQFMGDPSSNIATTTTTTTTTSSSWMGD